MLRIGMVVGETSGDLLGAGLINQLSTMTSPLVVEGIGGNKLIEAGMKSLYPMEQLSVMGITEVMGRYLELKKVRDELRDYFINNPPDVFIGIDAPDFNLTLERDLRLAGVKTVHYVSPSVWAWREYRIKKIKQSVDLMLTLFPFENALYDKHGVANKYVGHPLADRLLGHDAPKKARVDLGVPEAATVIAVLPGSRMNEINNIGPVLLSAAELLNSKNKNLFFISGLANQRTYDRFEELLKTGTGGLNLKLYLDKTHAVMNAADYILITSGTATLEAMLLNRPMVVAYRLSWLTYYIVKSLAKIPYASLPNILAGKKLVPECLQHDCNAETVASELQDLLDSEHKTSAMKKEFKHLSAELAVHADRRAAEAILELVNEK